MATDREGGEGKYSTWVCGMHGPRGIWARVVSLSDFRLFGANPIKGFYLLNGKNMILYRIEHPKSGIGPFTGGAYTAMNGSNPNPYSDPKLNRVFKTGIHKCACVSLTQLIDDWVFGEMGLKILSQLGFHVCEYEVHSDAFVGDHQVVFDPSQAVLRASIPIEMEQTND